MKELTLVPDSDSMLHSVMPEFDFTKPPTDPVELASNLITTMKKHGAMGLAANQCGLPYRVFVIDAAKGKLPYVCFNPRVVYESEEKASLMEGCLSFPNLWIKLKRADNIRVRFQDPYGETCTLMLGGYEARCFLHELDHLNGIVFTTRADRFHLEQARRKQKAINRKSK